MNEREYDIINNEGGEGYNPYRADRERKEFEERKARANEYALTPQGRIDALHRRIELECGSVAREWGNNDAIDTLHKDLYAQIRAIEDEANGPFLTIWTIGVTTERRAAWNARVRNGEFTKGKKVDTNALRAAEKAQGWTLDDLKKAVEIYKLRGEIA